MKKRKKLQSFSGSPLIGIVVVVSSQLLSHLEPFAFLQVFVCCIPVAKSYFPA